MPEPTTDQLLPIALCSPEDVINFLLESTSGIDSARANLIGLINYFSHQSQGPQWMNRELQQMERTEYHDLHDEDGFESELGRCGWVQIAAPPVLLTEAADTTQPPMPRISVWNSSAVPPVYNDAALLRLHFDYTVEHKMGLIKTRPPNFFYGGPQALKVIYTGGLVVAPEEGATNAPVAPHDLREACAMQVAAWWQRRKELNIESVAFPGGGALRIMDPTKMLTAVVDTLQHNRSYAGVA